MSYQPSLFELVNWVRSGQCRPAWRVRLWLRVMAAFVGTKPKSMKREWAAWLLSKLWAPQWGERWPQ